MNPNVENTHKYYNFKKADFVMLYNELQVVNWNMLLNYQLTQTQFANDSICLNQINKQQVCNAMEKLKNKPTAGLDKIHSFLIRN